MYVCRKVLIVYYLLTKVLPELKVFFVFSTICARLFFKVPKLIFRLSSAENYLKILSRKKYAKLSLIMI